MIHGHLLIIDIACPHIADPLLAFRIFSRHLLHGDRSILKVLDLPPVGIPVCHSGVYHNKDHYGAIMITQRYINRLFDKTVEFTLKSKGALVIIGPKWCGKSTTAKRYAKTIIDLMPLDSR